MRRVDRDVRFLFDILFLQTLKLSIDLYDQISSMLFFLMFEVEDAELLIEDFELIEDVELLSEFFLKPTSQDRSQNEKNPRQMSTMSTIFIFQNKSTCSCFI